MYVKHENCPHLEVRRQAGLNSRVSFFRPCSKKIAADALVLSVASHLTTLTILKEDDVTCHLRATI